MLRGSIYTSRRGAIGPCGQVRHDRLPGLLECLASDREVSSRELTLNSRFLNFPFIIRCCRYMHERGFASHRNLLGSSDLMFRW